jgi:NitT/TauT family transport system substrate-binding protein
MASARSGLGGRPARARRVSCQEFQDGSAGRHLIRMSFLTDFTPATPRATVTAWVDAAAAMIYNEYKQVLEAGVKPEDLVVIDFNQEGTSMLQDGIFVRADWIRDAKNKAIAARFLRASLKGWEHCRGKPAECLEIVLKETEGRGREHQAWMLAEVSKLVWGSPAPRGPLGKMDPEAFKRTADIAYRFGVIKKTADSAAYTDEIWEMAQKKPARSP